MSWLLEYRYPQNSSNYQSFNRIWTTDSISLEILDSLIWSASETLISNSLAYCLPPFIIDYHPLIIIDNHWSFDFHRWLLITVIDYRLPILISLLNKYTVPLKLFHDYFSIFIWYWAVEALLQLFYIEFILLSILLFIPYVRFGMFCF